MKSAQITQTQTEPETITAAPAESVWDAWQRHGMPVHRLHEIRFILGTCRDAAEGKNYDIYGALGIAARFLDETLGDIEVCTVEIDFKEPTPLFGPLNAEA